jgi:tryptophan-rich sensory protein
MRTIAWKKVVFSIVLCFLAGGVGSVFTASSIPTWYASLNKPFFNPPNWIFGPVWTTLYFLMAISFYSIWVSKYEKKKKKDAVIVFLLQLLLNTVWSIVFFGFKDPLLALVIILLLWASILSMIIKFYAIRKFSGLLQIPYLLWVSFATVLNISIVLLNT